MIRAVILVAAGLAAFALRPRRETLRKQRETALRASEGCYRTLFEYAPDGILIADPESNYIDANPSMCRMLGYTRAELTPVGDTGCGMDQATRRRIFEPSGAQLGRSQLMHSAILWAP